MEIKKTQKNCIKRKRELKFKSKIHKQTYIHTIKLKLKQTNFEQQQQRRKKLEIK